MGDGYGAVRLLWHMAAVVVTPGIVSLVPVYPAGHSQRGIIAVGASVTGELQGRKAEASVDPSVPKWERAYA